MSTETEMEKRKLGKTDLEVTVLGHGAMEIRGPRIWNGRPVTDKEAETILNKVLDSGINFVDTAFDYGRSEEFIGKYISKRRSEYFLATKCGCSIVDRGDHDETPHIWTEENLYYNIETSLKRMKTDYVDLWQLHNPSIEQTEEEDLIRVMENIKKSGKVRHIAISSTLPDIAEYIKRGIFESYQIPYSALERKHENIISRAASSGAGVIIRGGIARGEPGSGLGAEDKWDLWNKAGLDELLGPGENKTAFLLRFTISHPGMHSTIVGTKNPAHLDENIRIAESGPLSADVYEEVKKRLSAAGENPA